MALGRPKIALILTDDERVCGRRRARHLDVHLIMENYGTHKTPLIRNWPAKRVHFTPTYDSCLNLVERWLRRAHEQAAATRRPPQCQPAEDRD
jgi:transposase